MAITMGTSITCTLIIACLVNLVFTAPPGLLPLTGANIGPGAPVGNILAPDGETKSFAEYVESCQHPLRPGNQICSAYEEIHKFYLKLVPDSVSQATLKEAFAAHHNADIADLCRALGETGPAVTAIAVNGSNARYYKSLTESELCSRRCSDLDENDQVVVRPVCKVLAYELQEIKKRNSATEKVETEANAKITSPTSIEKNKTSTMTFSQEKPSPPVQPVVQASAISTPTNGTAPAAQPSPIVEQPQKESTPEVKKPASITPGTDPQLAEDIQPLAPVVSPKVSTSTTDYSGVLVPNNNEPEDNIKLPLVDIKQSPQSDSGKTVDGDQNKIGGSLDDDQGGQLDEDPFMGNGGDDDGDDGDYGMEEKIPVPELSKQDDKKSEKTNENSNKVNEAPPPQEVKIPTHNKKPTQVGDSFEVDSGRLEGSRVSEMIDDPFYEETDSNFFAYFLCVMALCVLGYVTYHNKNKLLGLMLEGRRGSSGRGGSTSGSRRGRGGSSRKHTAAYQKLDSNLEEAITSTGQSRTSQIIY